jgi:hypothetical protein
MNNRIALIIRGIAISIKFLINVIIDKIQPNFYLFSKQSINLTLYSINDYIFAANQLNVSTELKLK